MSMPREATTRSRMRSPNAQRRRRASSGEGGTKLLRLLVGVGLVRHGAATHLGAGQVLADARRAQRWVELQMEGIVRMVTDRSLMHGQDVGQPETPESVITPHHVA